MLNVDSTRTDMPDDTGAVAAQQLPEITTSEISEVDIRGAITRLRTRKRPGMDSISAEKCAHDTTMKMVHLLFNKIMAEQKVQHTGENRSSLKSQREEN